MSNAEARFRLYLFGAFRLEDRGRPVRLPTRKVESLLAFLALHPQPHTREQLATLLWGDMAPRSAAASLRNALSLLRKHLDTLVLAADRFTVRLDPDFPLWVDVHAFKHHWQAEPVPAESFPPAGAEAHGLYQGDLLADFYDDWIMPLREQYRRLHIARLLDLTQALRARSEYQQAIRLAQQVLDSDSANEPAHQHLIFCYLAAGNRAEAVAQYERCRATLQRELGVDPLPETTALYHWLRRVEPPAGAGHAVGAALPSNVPLPISSFVGRETEIARLRQALQPGPAAEAQPSPPARLLTLTGPGGCGKTRLAIQAALALLAERAYAGGVWWAALAPLSHGALVPQAVAQALGVRKPPSRSVAEALVEHLRPKQLLLVLDNCEHLVPACAGLAEKLLAACPGLQIVATSREALGVTGEIVWTVPPLSLPDRAAVSLSPEILLQSEGPRLFFERARAARRDFAVTEANAPGVARICRALDGLPLAIELAAAWVKAVAVEDIAARLAGDNSLALLTSGSRTALPRHQTLRAALGWSYNLLPEAEQALFRTLSVFAGGWTLEAAEAVVSGQWLVVSPPSTNSEPLTTDHQPLFTVDLLARLIDKSLVVAEYSSDRARYRYLDTIRAYAYDRLQAHNEADDARRRHLVFYAALAAITAATQYGPREFEALKQIDGDIDNLREALRTGQELPFAAEPALELACNLLRYWTVRGHWREGCEWLMALLACAGPAPSPLRARALTAFGFLAWRQGEVAAARTSYAQALEIARALGPEAVAERAHALRGLGLLAYAERRHDEARRLFEAALALFRQQGDATGIGYALAGLGEVARTEGRYDEAADYYAENLALRRAQGSELSAAICLHNSGQVALARGQASQARALLVECLTIYHRFGDQHGMAEALAGVAAVETARGAYARAARWFAASQAWLHTLGAVLDPSDQMVADHALQAVQAQMSPDQFAAAWAGGLALVADGGEAASAEALEGGVD